MRPGSCVPLYRLRHVIKEYPRAGAQVMSEREIPAIFARTLQRTEARTAQIFVEYANRRISDHVAWRRGGKCGNGTPLASASSSTSPKVSVRLGNTKTSAAA